MKKREPSSDSEEFKSCGLEAKDANCHARTEISECGNFLQDHEDEHVYAEKLRMSPEEKELWSKLERAEETECSARQMDERGFMPEGCESGWESEACLNCDRERQCRVKAREIGKESEKLLEMAWTLYNELLPLIRKSVEENNDEISWLMLATLLMDIDIHPNKMYEEPKKLYWEAQYCFLRLYYTTGIEEYMESARLCEAFRHATVTLVEGLEE